MKKIILNTVGFIGLAVVAFLFGLAADYGSQQEEKWNQELQAHVIETWENAPEDFHGHDCKFDEWCTKSFYDFLTNKNDHASSSSRK